MAHSVGESQSALVRCRTASGATITCADASPQTPKKRLYLDIDGVLIGKRNPRDMGRCLANRGLDFLEFALNNFECFWLSTHSRPGTTDHVLEYLDTFAEQEDKQPLRALASRVAPSCYKTLKVEALEGDFLWVDDQPIATEIEFLHERGWLNRWIQINTNKNPDGLLEAMERLETHLRVDAG